MRAPVQRARSSSHALCPGLEAAHSTALADHPLGSPEEVAAYVRAITPSDEERAAFLAALDDGGDAA